MFFIHVACSLTYVVFYFSFCWLHVYAVAIKSKVHCGSAFEPGASGLPYYCTLPVCVPDVSGGRTVWRQTLTKKYRNSHWCIPLQHPTLHALLPSPTPCQSKLVCGACIGTAQVGASLAIPWARGGEGVLAAARQMVTTKLRQKSNSIVLTCGGRKSAYLRVATVRL